MSTSILVQPKKRKASDELATIFIRGYYNSKPVASISTQQKITMDQWDPEKREVRPKVANAALINMVIQSKLVEMKKQLLQKEIMGASINRQHVIKAIRQKNDGMDFLLFCRDRIKEYSNKETRRTYNSEVSKLEQFQPAVSFNDVDYGFLNKYKAYMQQTLKNESNTVWKTFKFMNTMFNVAIKMGGIIKDNPFVEFSRGKYIQTKRNYLEIDHCDAIFSLTNHENKLIRQVAIYFLLMAYSGMRFSDAMRFNPATDVSDGRIIMKYEKFDTQVNNKMYNRLKEVVNLVKENHLHISNKDFNDQLKIIGGICNIGINMTAHVGRHTMGGMLAEMEIPEEQAMIILGQRDIRSTRIYYHVKNKNIDKAMDKLNGL